jgi:hypothetical protein
MYKTVSIVRWDNGNWKFTDYGYLLAYHVYEKERDPTWIQAIGMGEQSRKRYVTAEGESILENGMSYFYNNYKKTYETGLYL